MGTNVYIKKKMTKEQKEHLHKLVDLEDTMGIKDFIDSNPQKIHLGKCSYGWVFSFEEHLDLYSDTRESINAYISNQDVQIVDEYGEIYTPQQFWKKFIDDRKSDDLLYHCVEAQKHYPNLYGDNVERYMKHKGISTRSELPVLAINEHGWVSEEGLSFCFGDFS